MNKDVVLVKFNKSKIINLYTAKTLTNVEISSNKDKCKHIQYNRKNSCCIKGNSSTDNYAVTLGHYVLYMTYKVPDEKAQEKK